MEWRGGEGGSGGLGYGFRNNYFVSSEIGVNMDQALTSHRKKLIDVKHMNLDVLVSRAEELYLVWRRRVSW